MEQNRLNQNSDDECEFVFQAEQLGTAHAVLQASELLKDKEGTHCCLWRYTFIHS